MTHGGEDRARGIDVRGGRNSMNYYRLAAHFASRSCDRLVKRFGLSSNPFPASLLHQHDAASYIPPCYSSFFFFFFHCTPSRRPAGVVKRVSGVVGHPGFSKRKTSHEDARAFEFHRVEGEDEGGESRSSGRFYKVLFLAHRSFSADSGGK